MKKRASTSKFTCTVCAVLLLVFSASHAVAEQTSMTIELDDMAVLVQADRSVLDEIGKWSEAHRNAGAPQLFGYISKSFSDRARMEVFLADKTVEESAGPVGYMTIRDAVLDGVIPPIEGLSRDEAAIVLARFNFVSLTEREYANLPRRTRRSINLGKSLIVFMSATAPMDRIAMYAPIEKAESTNR